MTAFDTLAEPFEAGRLGYANDVYNNLVSFGLKQSNAVLDVGCGTGLSSGPLIENGFNVSGLDVSQPMVSRAKARYPGAKWGIGAAEKIPVQNDSFEVVISGQAFHFFDRDAALKEAHRVLKKNGILSIWWKQLSADDPIKMLRDSVVSDARFVDASDRNSRGLPLLAEGLTGGFKELYGMPFRDQSVRVIPWRTTTMLARHMQYERSRSEVREALGARADEYFALLERRLLDRFGALDAIVPLSFTHFQYLARK